MSRLKIVPGVGPSTHGTEVYLDGHKLQGVTGITLVAKTQDVWKCTIDLIVDPDDLELGADVTVVVSPPMRDGVGGVESS